MLDCVARSVPRSLSQRTRPGRRSRRGWSGAELWSGLRASVGHYGAIHRTGTRPGRWTVGARRFTAAARSADGGSLRGDAPPRSRGERHRSLDVAAGDDSRSAARRIDDGVGRGLQSVSLRAASRCSVVPTGLVVEVEGALVSRPYVEMTVATMRRFGAHVDDDGTFFA
jgi:hypothetical protein